MSRPQPFEQSTQADCTHATCFRPRRARASTRTGQSSPGANGVRAPQRSAIRRPPSAFAPRTDTSSCESQNPCLAVARLPFSRAFQPLTEKRGSRCLRRSATSEIALDVRGTRAQLIGLPRAAASVSPRCRGLTSIGLGLRRRSSALASERLGQPPEHQAKDGVSPRCLDERLAVLEKGWHAGLRPVAGGSGRRSSKVDTERSMLAQAPTQSPSVMRPRRPSTARLVVCQPEQSTV